jgi:CBS domain-containing protein
VELIFGELTPKWIALEKSEATAIWVVKPLELFMRTLWPFIRLVHGAAQGVIRALGMKGADRRAMVHSEEELKMLVTASQEAGVLEEHEEQMLHRVFGFADMTAGQVMVPRTELVAVAANTPLDALVAQVVRGGHTRLPVYRADLDDIAGMLHVTDMMKALSSGGGNVDAGSLAREALTVPETLRADDLLAEAAKHESADGCVRRLIDVQIEVAVHVRDKREAVDRGRAIVEHDDALGRGAEFAAQVSNHSLHHRLECHQSCRSAVFVDDDRFAHAPAPHLGQQIVGSQCFGHGQRFPRQRSGVHVATA